MSRVLDLDAARAARQEAQQEAPVIRFGGTDFVLPVELPWTVAEAASEGTGAGAFRAIELLLGDQWVTFTTLNPSVADVLEIVQGIAGIYGVDPGK